MQDLLFDTPIWLFALVILAGVGLWLAGNARQDKKLRFAGYAAAGVAILLALLSFFVDTDREKVARGTREIVRAVDQKDRATAERLLHARANLAGMDKAQIVERVATAADQFNVKRVRITSMDLQPTGDEMTVTLSATADVDSSLFSGPIPSTWELVWEKTTRGWLLKDIRPKTVPGMGTDTLVDRLRSLASPGK